MPTTLTIFAAIGFILVAQYGFFMHFLGTSCRTDSSHKLLNDRFDAPQTLQQKQQDTLAYPPLSCRDFLRDYRAQSSLNAPIDPNNNATIESHNGYFRLTNNRFLPRFWISLHHGGADRVRWGIMKRGEYYEEMLTDAVIKSLSEHPGSMMLDVGGNIGWFALVAASQGHDVATFEPNPVNQRRMCESIQLNGWTDSSSGVGDGDGGLSPVVNLYPYGVGNEHGKVLTLKQSDNANPGAGTFEQRASRVRGAVSHDVALVSVDEMAKQNGWIDQNGKALGKTIGFMKVDVEGFEPQVFLGAHQLLASGIVKNVYFEFNSAQEDIARRRRGETTAVRFLVQNGYYLHRVGNWKGPKDGMAIPEIDDQFEERVAKDYKRRHINLWFRLKEAGN